MMLMGLLPFSPKAQDTVIYPYMNYLNMPCDDPSVYFCPKSHAACSNNSGAYTCEKTVYAAEVFNYPVAGNGVPPIQQYPPQEKPGGTLIVIED